MTTEIKSRGKGIYQAIGLGDIEASDPVAISPRSNRCYVHGSGKLGGGVCIIEVQLFEGDAGWHPAVDMLGVPVVFKQSDASLIHTGHALAVRGRMTGSVDAEFDLLFAPAVA